MQAGEPTLATTSARNKRVLALLAAIALAPVVVSYALYYFWPRDARANYGTLLATHPLAPIHGTRLDGTSFASDGVAGRWLVVYAAPGGCPGACEDALYATRQARTIQNAERERIVRLWLVTDDARPARALVAGHPDLAIVAVPREALAQLPQGGDAIYLVDPLGNFVLAWPSKPDIKAMAKDLARLLRASSIG
jgi:hypothetical protein